MVSSSSVEFEEEEVVLLGIENLTFFENLALNIFGVKHWGMNVPEE